MNRKKIPCYLNAVQNLLAQMVDKNCFPKIIFVNGIIGQALIRMDNSVPISANCSPTAASYSLRVSVLHYALM